MNRSLLRRRTAGAMLSQPVGLCPYRPRFEALEARYLLSLTAAVMGRHIFYDNSAFDGNQPGISALDDAAIATDKTALLGDATLAAHENITSYTRGVNGIMVDISGSHPAITTADFIFRVGSDNSPGTWDPAPQPSGLSVRPGAGVGGSDRVEIVWPDGAIRNTMLQVIVAANERTGLAQSDVFFFGNRVGDSGTGTPASAFQTTSTDAAQVFGNLTGGAAIDNLRDYNRSGGVTAADAAVVFGNLGSLNRIEVTITPPALTAGLTLDTGPFGVPNADGITKDPRVSGTLTASTAIATFQARLNGGALMDASAMLSGASYTLTQAFLDTLNGGAPIPDGAHVVQVQAVDADGLGAAAETAFTLKRSMTAPAIPDLIDADDTGASSTDDITKINTPRIDVTAETGSIVQLFINDVLADTDIGAPGLQFMVGPLSDGTQNIRVETQDGAGNWAQSPILPITISTVAPTISLSTKVTISSDLTPHVSVSASGPLGLANGTLVTVDVDLDYDGNFSGVDELDRTTSPLHLGKSFFQVTPALPADMGGAAYNVQLRARVTDIAGNEGTSAPKSLKIDRIGNTVLDDYVTPDPTPTYSIVATYGGVGQGYTTYVIDMTSQTWLTAADTDKPVWKHWVVISVPEGPISDTALLFVNGGNNTSGPPGFGSDEVALTTLVAQSLQSVMVYLPTVPSQPLKFLAEPGQPNRSEDALIAYTFDRYKDHLGEPGNEDWPALLPMVQSAVAAMDTTQAVVPSVEDFVVTGYSKRGWTTWLTAATDDRVRAIIPGVIDILNMGEQMVHHYGAYGFFGSAISPYTAFNIPQDSYTVGGQEIGRVVDPYTYIYNGRFDDMPKLMINSSGDEFFLPDAAQFYFHDLPGTDNYLRYIPNTSHGLNQIDPVVSTVSFFTDVVNGVPLPEFSWELQQDGSIVVHTVDTPTSVTLWQAFNPTNRDFRKNNNPSIIWTDSALAPTSPGVYVASVATPTNGARAFFVELTFPSSNPDYPHIFTTQIKVNTNMTPFAWPFFMPTIPPPGGGSFAPEGSGAVDRTTAQGLGPIGANSGESSLGLAFAIAASADDGAGAMQEPPKPATAAAAPVSAEGADEVLAADYAWTEQDDDELAPADEDDEPALLLLGDAWR